MPDHSAGGAAGTPFALRVRRVVASIRAGQVMTYKQVAAAAGRPGAWRAVGNILGRNYDPGVPCHRVIRSDGRTGGYNRGRRRKALLLRSEARTARSGRISAA